jgi:protein-L-isoaspartate(D-aspartate) O-methyltransferase
MLPYECHIKQSETKYIKAVFNVLFVVFYISVSGCNQEPDVKNNQPQKPIPQQKEVTSKDSTDQTPPRSNERMEERLRMVQIIRDYYGLDDPVVLQAMENVPRHWFVPDHQQRSAYADNPLPIGQGQTISQPYIVAFMTHLLDLNENSKVLEIGTGSGYQAAVLSELTPHVYTIEILEPLGRQAQEYFAKYEYTTIQTLIGDGYKGWPQHQPFDGIIVTCAPDHIPPALLEQLRPGGKMVIPVGGEYQVQELVLVTKNEQGEITKKSVIPVRFVPMLRE